MNFVEFFVVQLHNRTLLYDIDQIVINNYCKNIKTVRNLLK